jgi:hypothetical protein
MRVDAKISRGRNEETRKAGKKSREQHGVLWIKARHRIE